MKKIVLTAAFAMSVFFVQAQITINRSDIASKPATIRYTVDEGFSLSNITDVGTGKTWDLKSLQNEGEVVSQFDDPANWPDAGNYPSANLAVVLDSAEGTVYYVEDSNDSLVVVGTSEPGTDGVRFRQLIFPLSMGTNWSDKSGFSLSYSGAEIGQPMVDSARYNVKVNFMNTADAEGALKFPKGSIDALKVTTIVITESVIDIKYMGVWQSGTPETSTDTSYSFYSKNNGLYVAALSSNGNGTYQAQYKQNVVGLASVNKFKQFENAVRVYPNPTAQYLNIESAKADTYVITDILGKNIMNGNTSSSIDVSALAKGNYIIQLFQDEQLISVNKFIKD